MFSKYRKLGDITILCFVYYVLIFAIIFWVLTLINMAFNKKKNHFFKKKYYECGFGSLSDINISININFLLIGVFLILYDIEFTFLFPFIINIGIVNVYSFAVFTTFYLLIIISLLYDWQRDALDWQY